MANVGVKAINIFSELDRLKVQWTSSGDDEIRIACPVHDDSSPSASLNTDSYLWKCFVPSCGAAGDFVSFIAHLTRQPRQVVMADLQQRYPDIAGISEIPSQTVEKFHAAISQAGPLLKELRKRGVTDAMIREARIGFHDTRITIPVYDQAGRCVNVRRYLPGAPAAEKMRNTRGHGAPVLYRAATVEKADRVMVCGGELKALVAGHLLAGKVACVCSTGGEGHWDDDWTGMLKGKVAYVMMDVDDAGYTGAQRMAMRLFSKAKEVRIVRLPLDKQRFPKGDVNDWVGQCGATAEMLEKLLEETPVWVPPQMQKQLTGEPRRRPLDQAVASSAVGEVVIVDAVVAAADQTPFLVAKDLDVECDRGQPQCAMCAVRNCLPDVHTGWTRMRVEPGSPAILGMMGAGESSQRERLMEAVGIPSGCKVAQFTARSHHIVHDVRLSPPMDMTGGKINDSWYPAVVVADRCPELNVPCRMTGTIYPHPRSQQAVALIHETEELDDTLSSFKCSTDELAELEIFRPAVMTADGVESKMMAIADDLAANVTWIYERPVLHVAMDMAFHSPLLFELDGRQVNGWLQVLVIGDSSQGKSECAIRLMKHYGAGDKVDCKNATVAGLLGGLEQLGNRWFVRWGAIPMRDRTLVTLEELKGASVEVLSKLTEMRSSGVAEIPKIERRKAMARTRLIMNSNPRTPRPMASFHFGVEAVHELMGALEDVRRLDLAIALSRDEVSEEVTSMRRSLRRKVPHEATQVLCRRLVLWAWTRTVDQVRFTDDAADAVADEAKRLCGKFSESIPLVDRGTIRQKLARMAAATAARTFSTRDGMVLDVEACHAQFAARFVDQAYSSKAMGYDAFSSAQKLLSSVQDPEEVARAIRQTRHPTDLASVLLRMDVVTVDDIQAAAAVDFDGARGILSVLVRKGALLRATRNGYAKNPQFIEILKRIRSSTVPRKDEHDTSGSEF